MDSPKQEYMYQETPLPKSAYDSNNGSYSLTSKRQVKGNCVPKGYKKFDIGELLDKTGNTKGPYIYGKTEEHIIPFFMENKISVELVYQETKTSKKVNPKTPKRVTTFHTEVANLLPIPNIPKVKLDDDDDLPLPLRGALTPCRQPVTPQLLPTTINGVHIAPPFADMGGSGIKYPFGANKTRLPTHKNYDCKSDNSDTESDGESDYDDDIEIANLFNDPNFSIDTDTDTEEYSDDCEYPINTHKPKETMSFAPTIKPLDIFTIPKKKVSIKKKKPTCKPGKVSAYKIGKNMSDVEQIPDSAINSMCNFSFDGVKTKARIINITDGDTIRILVYIKLNTLVEGKEVNVGRGKNRHVETKYPIIANVKSDGFFITLNVRILGIDTAEKNTYHGQEVIKQITKKYESLNNIVWVKLSKPGMYGSRTLADVYEDSKYTKHINDFLFSIKYKGQKTAMPYDGTKKSDYIKNLPKISS